VDNEQIYSSKYKLLEFLGIRENFLYKDFSKKYSEIEKPKKNGGTRKIQPPSPNLKKTQRLILDKILTKHLVLPCVYGLSKDRTILANAKIHQKNASDQLVVLDIENFFPSIKRKQIIQVFRGLGFNKENAAILTKICTINDELPQGAPTSPYLASLACDKLDKEIYNYCKLRGFEYTRYFDDISISGKNILDKHIKHIEKIIIKHSFKCNNSKREFYDFNSNNKAINGVVINRDKLSVTEKYKREIEESYRNLTADKTLQNERIFSGKIGFYLYINKKEATTFKDQIEKSV
jgi:RNA-directed DNA polymerase